MDHQTFYTEMQSQFPHLLSPKVLAHKPVYHVRSNRMHIVLEGITGSHYEICLRQNYHEIALHFQSTPARSLERRQVFDPQLDRYSKILGVPVKSGKLENRGWMRVWIERPVRPVNAQLLREYTALFARFISETFPLLEEVYRLEALT